MDWTFVAVVISIVAVIISLLSSGLAAYVTYKTTLSPFDLKISIGHPLMGGSPDAKKERYTLTPIIPMEFLNLGAKSGEVRDIAIVVSAGSLKWLLEGKFFCKEFGMKSISEKYREVFHPFILNGKDRIYKNILFNPPLFPPKSLKAPIMKNNEPLPKGTYVFKLYINAGDSNQLQLITTKKYYMPERAVLDLAAGKGGLYFPFDESLEAARNSFVKSLSP